MLIDDLENYLKTYNEYESIAINTGLTNIKDISKLTDGQILSANNFIKDTEKITFMKHPRFVEIFQHKHDFIEISYAYSGNFTQVINNQVLEMREGDLTILDMDVLHTIKKVEEDTIIVNILLRKDYFNQGILARLTDNDLISKFVIDAIYKPTIDGRFLYFPSHRNDKVSQYISTAMCEYLDSDIAASEVINCNMILLFTELLRISKKTNPSINDITKSRISFVEILKYVEENYLTVTLTEVAQQTHFHPNYLSRLFKESLGKNFSDMIQEIRLRQAKLLLENTHLKINRIADEVGYTNYNHFYKKFKGEFNVTPAEYRKQFVEQRDNKP